MHTEAKVTGQIREALGKRATRQMRKKGLIPANIYGHGQPPVSFSVTTESLMPAVRAGVKVIDITVGDKTDKALVREVQWDTFGMEVLHIDLVRVDPNEKIQVEVPIETKGTAPGAIRGGVLEFGLRTLLLECSVINIPDHFVVRIGNLEVGQAIHVRDLEVPEGVRVMNDPDTIVVHVVQIQVIDETAEAGVTQPELIRKPEKEAAEEK